MGTTCLRLCGTLEAGTISVMVMGLPTPTTGTRTGLRTSLRRTTVVTSRRSSLMTALRVTGTEALLCLTRTLGTTRGLRVRTPERLRTGLSALRSVTLPLLAPCAVEGHSHSDVQ